MRPIATTTSDFDRLRTDGCIYVDKTAYFHRLVCDVGTNFCFLARPRRFGKSLMITALKEIFRGRRELFDGLSFDSKTRHLVDAAAECEGSDGMDIDK